MQSQFPLLLGLKSPEAVKFFAETFVERVALDGEFNRGHNEIVEESFDKIMGIRHKSAVLRTLRRLVIQVEAELRFRKYGQFLLPGCVMLLFTIILAASLFFQTLALPILVLTILNGFTLMAMALFMIGIMFIIPTVMITLISSTSSKTEPGPDRLSLWAGLFLLQIGNII